MKICLTLALVALIAVLHLCAYSYGEQARQFDRDREDYVSGPYHGQSAHEDEYINELLIYPSVHSAVIEYPDLRSNSSFRIAYSDLIDPEHLVVELDGKDITSLFNPEPARMEMAKLPPIEGKKKRLTLRIPELLEESSAATPQWDYDEFEIIAEPSQSLMIMPTDFDFSKYPKFVK